MSNSQHITKVVNQCEIFTFLKKIDQNIIPTYQRYCIKLISLVILWTVWYNVTNFCQVYSKRILWLLRATTRHEHVEVWYIHKRSEQRPFSRTIRAFHVTLLGISKNFFNRTSIKNVWTTKTRAYSWQSENVVALLA